MPVEQKTEPKFLLEQLAAMLPTGSSDLDVHCGGCNECAPDA